MKTNMASNKINTVGDKGIKDTGERMVPAHHKAKMMYGEHIVRYRAVADLVKNKVVLDIASGSGYGSALIGKTAKQVYGVDIDSETTKYAKRNYTSGNIKFLLGDATKIPLDNNTIDIVVSFETIEHVKKYQAFMSEIKRVLKKNGLLILSTPNDVEFAEGNHFHIHEFKRSELEVLVKKYFKNYKPYYQVTWLYNALLEEEKVRQEWEERLLTLNTAPVDLKKCIYFFLLCSDVPIKRNIKPVAAISEHWSARRIQDYEKSIRKHIDEQAVIIQYKTDELNHLKKRNQQLRRDLRYANKRLQKIYNSLPGKFIKSAIKIKRKLSRSKRI